MKKEVWLTFLTEGWRVLQVQRGTLLPNERTWFGNEKETVQMPQESSVMPRKMHYLKNGEFGVQDRKPLQRALWCLHFVWRARDKSRKLYWRDVELASDPETDSEFLVFMWRHHFPKQKNIYPCEVLVLSYARPSKNLTPCWCPCTWAPTRRLHTKLWKFGWNTFPHNARMNYRTDLNLNLAKSFIYQSCFISQFLDLIYWMVTIFIFDGVTLQTQPYLASKSERGSKTRTGQDGGHQKACEPRAHTSNNKSGCPVEFYNPFEVTEVTAFVLYWRPRSRFSHTDLQLG